MRPTGGGPAVRRMRAPAARWRAASPRATRAHDRPHAAGLELGLEDRQAARRVLRVMPARGAQRHALEEALASVGHPSSYPQR